MSGGFLSLLSCSEGFWCMDSSLLSYLMHTTGAPSMAVRTVIIACNPSWTKLTISSSSLHSCVLLSSPWHQVFPFPMYIQKTLSQPQTSLVSMGRLRQHISATFDIADAQDDASKRTHLGMIVLNMSYLNFTAIAPCDMLSDIFDVIRIQVPWCPSPHAGCTYFYSRR